MKLQTLQTEIDENLNVATMLDSDIYHINNNTLYKTNIYTGHKSTIMDNIQCDIILNTNNDLLLINGNKITIINRKGDIIKQHNLNDFVKKVRTHKGIIVILTNTDDFYRVEKSNLVKIRTTRKPKDNVAIDFEITDKQAFVLTENNEIYVVNNLLANTLISYNEKLTIIEYNNLEKCNAINIRENRFYLQHKNGFVIYKRKNNILLPFYDFKNPDYNLFFYDYVYLSHNGVFLMKNMPIKILDDSAAYIFEKVIICSKYITIVESSSTKRSMAIPHYETETDPAIRVDRLFSKFSINQTDKRRVPNEITEEDFILLMDDINSYKAKHLNQIKIVYLELNTLCMSFNDKLAVIETMKKEIKTKIKTIENIKKRLCNEIFTINNHLEKILQDRSIDGDESLMKHKIEICKKQIMDTKIKCDKSVIQRLKLQRAILRNATE